MDSEHLCVRGNELRRPGQLWGRQWWPHGGQGWKKTKLEIEDYSWKRNSSSGQKWPLAAGRDHQLGHWVWRQVACCVFSCFLTFLILETVREFIRGSRSSGPGSGTWSRTELEATSTKLLSNDQTPHNWWQAQILNALAPAVASSMLSWYKQIYLSSWYLPTL